MYDETRKFSKKHWAGLLFLMVVLGAIAIFSGNNDEEPNPSESITSDIYPEFAAMYDAKGNLGTLHTGTISGVMFGHPFSGMPVQYTEVNGLPIYQGDIILRLDRPSQAGVGIAGEKYLWPDLVAYQIDPKLPDQERITGAIKHWEERTSIRFVERTGDNASQYSNYINFRPGLGCSSYVGMQGGSQPINLASACSLGNTIHEIGHALGTWHEQSRNDRDEYVEIRYENIMSGTTQNFDKAGSRGIDIGPYDYGSIMHYPRWAFSKNGEDTIVPHGNQEIGQRDGLSEGDIATIEIMYGN